MAINVNLIIQDVAKYLISVIRYAFELFLSQPFAVQQQISIDKLYEVIKRYREGHVRFLFHFFPSAVAEPGSIHYLRNYNV